MASEKNATAQRAATISWSGKVNNRQVAHKPSSLLVVSTIFQTDSLVDVSQFFGESCPPTTQFSDPGEKKGVLLGEDHS